MVNKYIKRTVCCICAVTSLFSLAGAYNRTAAISYSDKYAKDPNDLPIAGGYKYYDQDCTNFVSQCLYAGGMDQDNTWWSKLATSGSGASTWRNDSTAWINANALKDYLKNNNKAKKIGSWAQRDTPYATQYIDNSANLTSSNTGKTVLFYDWDGDGVMNHAAFFVVNNAKSLETEDDGNVTGDLINQHTENRKHAIWHGDKRNTDAKTTEIHGFELNV